MTPSTSLTSVEMYVYEGSLLVGWGSVLMGTDRQTDSKDDTIR